MCNFTPSRIVSYSAEGGNKKEQVILVDNKFFSFGGNVVVCRGCKTPLVPVSDDVGTGIGRCLTPDCPDTERRKRFGNRHIDLRCSHCGIAYFASRHGFTGFNCLINPGHHIVLKPDPPLARKVGGAL